MNYSEFLAEASKIIRTSSVEVERVIITAPYRYKHYKIGKRNGGTRDIHHPSPALKALQRWISTEILSALPVHESVYSYRKGRNIAMHASAHSTANYFTRFDFTDFFPSINGRVIKALINASVSRGLIDLDLRTVEAVVRLVCRINRETNNLVLSIGAPSSPHLSNAMLFEFDRTMAEFAATKNGLYSRYADDVYVSARSKEIVSVLNDKFLICSAAMLPYLTVNSKKTQHLSRRRRVSVTGINITPQRTLSIGREIKRSVKTRVYLALQSKLAIDELHSLKGMLSHARSVEPSFIDSLGRKFGYAEISQLLDASTDYVVTSAGQASALVEQ